MKRIFAFIIATCFFMIANNSCLAHGSERRYRTCKVQCKEDASSCQDAKACMQDCDYDYCKAQCREKHQDYKNSKACKEFYACKINHQDPCDPVPCLEGAHDEAECLQACRNDLHEDYDRQCKKCNGKK